MEGKITGFLIWCAFGIMVLCLAVYAWFSRKPVRFWANAEVFQVTDIKKYNRAVSKLFFIFGITWIALGTPLLPGKNSSWALLSVAGIMIESIIAMAVYSLVIEKKYKLEK